MHTTELVCSNGNSISTFLSDEKCSSPKNIKFSLTLNSHFDVLPVEVNREHLKEVLLNLVSYLQLSDTNIFKD